MFRFLSLILVLLSTVLFYGYSVMAQAPSPYIYRIKAAGCIHEPEERQLTGFRMKSKKGIVTALHGVVDCETINAVTDASYFNDLHIREVDIERDSALLLSDELYGRPFGEGFAIAQDIEDFVHQDFKVIGYPIRLAKQRPLVRVPIVGEKLLNDLIPPPNQKALRVRNSPSPYLSVLHIQTFLIPGDSGGPVLNSKDQVIGIGNGGLEGGTVGIGWVIPINGIEWQSTSRLDVQEKLSEVINSDPELALSFSSTYPKPTFLPTRKHVVPSIATPISTYISIPMPTEIHNPTPTPAFIPADTPYPTPIFIPTATSTSGALTIDFPQKLAIPAYFPPGPTWIQLESGVPTVGLAVINPASGSGKYPELSYQIQVNNTRDKGVIVIGYVDTNRGKRDITLVQNEIDRYYQWYNIDGIFVDRAKPTCDGLTYYQDVYNHIKATDSTAKVVLNPGSTTNQCFMAVSDIIVTASTDYQNYSKFWQLEGWETAYPADRFWHLIYETDYADLQTAIDISKRNYAGWVYVTDGNRDNNTWNTLPNDSYWKDELNLASHLGE